MGESLIQGDVAFSGSVGSSRLKESSVEEDGCFTII